MHTREATFGYHPATCPPSISNQYLTDRSKFKIDPIITKTLLTTFMIGLSAIPFLALPLLTATATVVAGFAITYFLFKVWKQSNLSQTAGIIFNKKDINKLKLTPKFGKCQVIPTEHSADTELWRKRLIEAAEENIVISGNYCGGNAFIDFLNLIEKRIGEKPQLKVVILSSPMFLKGRCKARLDKILKKFPQNVSLVESPSIIHISPGIKKTTNHTKCMVIDYGRYFILGGSGIRDHFTQTGLEDLTKKEFLESNGEVLSSEMEASSGLFELVLPRYFRDQDFVFSSNSKNNPVGLQVYKQMLLLSHRWEVINKQKKSFFIKKPKHISLKGFGLFSNMQTAFKEKDSLTTKLLKTPPKELHSLSCSLEKFEMSAKKANRVFCKVFASGPESEKSPFAGELLNHIKKAKKRIVISQMYFHPTTELRNALIEAAKRGVKIEILTCGTYTSAPKSHTAFAPRNRYNYSVVMNSLSPQDRKNISIYEFRVNKTTFHKKIFVIDDTVISGSSNFGYKSLVTCSDHELNFIAKSKKLAEETLKVHKVDVAHSHKITHPLSRYWSLSLGEYGRAVLHRLMAPLIG
jgi:hypothetical protein